METEIITIGDEILIGQTIDTNSAWIAQQLNQIGGELGHITSCRDEQDAIVDSLDVAKNRADLIIMTGGLGPTRDDITKTTLCEYFDTSLQRNQLILNKIEEFFQTRGREMLEVNRQQADLPLSCTILENNIGTASGMWFEKDEKVFISLPGVPYEMKHLMELQVFPRLKKYFKLPVIYQKTMMTEGLGESFLAELVKDWEASLDKEAIKIAYLPSPGMVKVRLTAKGEDIHSLKTKIQRKADELKSLIPTYVFAEEDCSPDEAISKLLKEKQQTVATAESCTGGYLAHLLTSQAGSSQYFLGSIITYSNAVKIKQLNVEEAALEQNGAVSKEVVSQMAANIRQQMGTDYALATSGIAGPDGGTEDKPVGTVWIAIASSAGVYAKCFHFEKNRERNIHRAAIAALSLLRRVLNGQLKIGLK